MYRFTNSWPTWAPRIQLLVNSKSLCCKSFLQRWQRDAVYVNTVYAQHALVWFYIAWQARILHCSVQAKYDHFLLRFCHKSRACPAAPSGVKWCAMLDRTTKWHATLVTLHWCNCFLSLWSDPSMQRTVCLFVQLELNSKHFSPHLFVACCIWIEKRLCLDWDLNPLSSERVNDLLPNASLPYGQVRLMQVC